MPQTPGSGAVLPLAAGETRGSGSAATSGSRCPSLGKSPGVAPCCGSSQEPRLPSHVPQGRVCALRLRSGVGERGAGHELGAKYASPSPSWAPGRPSWVPAADPAPPRLAAGGCKALLKPLDAETKLPLQRQGAFVWRPWREPRITLEAVWAAISTRWLET